MMDTWLEHGLLRAVGGVDVLPGTVPSGCRDALTSGASSLISHDEAHAKKADQMRLRVDSLTGNQGGRVSRLPPKNDSTSDAPAPAHHFYSKGHFIPSPEFFFSPPCMINFSIKTFYRSPKITAFKYMHMFIFIYIALCLHMLTDNFFLAAKSDALMDSVLLIVIVWKGTW